MPSLLFEDILKANPYHDPKNGRFTFAPGGSSSAWASKLAEEKARVLSLKPNEQALYVCENDGETEDNCVGAMYNKQTEALVNNYFAIMEANGDPTPTKRKSGQLNIDLALEVEDGEYEGYEEARLAYIQNMSGQSASAAKTTLKEFETWFSNSWDKADTAVIDKYIEADHVYDGTMYRGMRFGDVADFDAFMKDVSPGAQIQMRRNSSWSNSEETARRFGNHVYDNMNTVMITCVKNRTSAPVAHLSTQGEGEIIAHSKARWTVLHSEVYQWSSGAKKAYLTVVETGEYDGDS